MNRCDYDNYLRGYYKTHASMLVCLHKQPYLWFLFKHLLIQAKWFIMNLLIQLLFELTHPLDSIHHLESARDRKQTKEDHLQIPIWAGQIRNF